MKTANQHSATPPKKQWVEPELVELPIGETRNNPFGFTGNDGGGPFSYS